MAAARPLTLPAPTMTTGPLTPAERAEIGGRIKRRRKLLTILSTLATGWLPWGVEWKRRIDRHENEWPLCCGHVLGFAEAQALVSAGLLALVEGASVTAGALTITPAGRHWLSWNWSPRRSRRPTEPPPRRIRGPQDF